MQKQQGGFSLGIVLVLGLLLCVIGFAAWRISLMNQSDEEQQINSFEECKAAGFPIMESYPEQCAANGRTFTNMAQSVDDGLPVNEPVSSGQNGFSLIFPADWKGITKVKDSDWFIIPGTDQPREAGYRGPGITESDSYGTDSPSIFSVLVHDNFSAPEGTPTDYTLVNGKENPITGKKYTKEYTEDEIIGIGYQRIKGDRDYTYVFEIGDGKQLRIEYSVWASDPRNLIEDVEAIVDSIRLN